VPGPGAAPDRVQGFLGGMAPTITVNQILAAMVAVSTGRVRVVRCVATSVGAAGSTVIDMRRNGVSMYRTAAQRPTLVGTASGQFSAFAPDEQAFQPGDVLSLIVATSAGHGGVIATAALEEP